MNALHIKAWKVKLKAARLEQRQWARAYNRAEKALFRLSRQIEDLENKLGLAKTE